MPEMFFNNFLSTVKDCQYETKLEILPPKLLASETEGPSPNWRGSSCFPNSVQNSYKLQNGCMETLCYVVQLVLLEFL